LKLKLKIFTYLNLTLFLSSFVLIIFTSFQALNVKNNASSFEVQFSQSIQGFNSNGQPLSENNEFEDDNDDFEIVSFIMPFLVSFEQLEIILAISPRHLSKTEIYREAIYLALNNIRI
jgi:hypothetical protein